MKWLLPGYLLLVGLLPVAYWPLDLLLAWQEHAWPALFTFWQTVQQALPFPVAAVVLPVLLLALLGLPLFLWLRRRKPVQAGYSFVLVVSVLVCWLQLGWAPNYLRPGVAGQLQLDAQATRAQNLQLAEYLLAVLQDHAEAPADLDAAITAASAELDRLLEPLGYPGPIRSEPQQVPAGTFLVFGVAGSLFPLSLEAFVDAGLTDWQHVAVSVHELSHVAGVAREDDATLLAALAGLRSGHGYARYALALDSLTRVELPTGVRQVILEQLPARASADLEAAAERDAAYRLPALSTVQNALFGFWLRSQGSEQGVADYSLGASRLPLALEAGLLP